MKAGLIALSILIAANAAVAVTGDLNRDGTVDFEDFFIFSDFFGQSGEPEVWGEVAQEGISGGIGEYYPLQVGNMWVYENPWRLEDAYLRKVTEVEDREGVDYFSINNGSKMYVEEGELRVVYSSGPESVLLKEPLAVGATWQDDYDLEDCPRAECGSEIREWLAELETPAGRFEDVLVVVWGMTDSVQLSGDGWKMEYVYYIARGAGVVAREIRTFLADGTINTRRHEVDEYTLSE